MSEGPVIAPLDGSAHALVSVPVARTLADALGRELRFLHVAGTTPAPEGLLDRLGIDEETLRGSLIEVRRGDPAEEIARAARETGAWVVLCSRTADRVEEVALGHTARAVLERAMGPVVFVRPDRGIAPWRLERILLPYDGTPTTAAAIGPAADLARARHAELRVLHVATAGEAPRERGALTAPRYTDQPQHEWPSWAEEFLGRLGCVCALEDIAVRLVLGHGDPATETLRAAEESDLLVLAWHGSLEGGRAALVKDALERSPCPVLVLRAK